MKRVVVVGAGTVGRATGTVLASLGHEVLFVDPSPSTREVLAAEGWSTSDTAVFGGSHTTVFLCVPTPADEHGYDLSALEDSVRSTVRAATRYDGTVDLAVRSTVPPGTCDGPVAAWAMEEDPNGSADRLAVVHCPEFLRQDHASVDAMNPRAVVVGSVERQAALRVAELLAAPGVRVDCLDTATAAELVKCSHNAYNATKISFWNEIELLARQFGVDADAVSAVVSHTAEASWNPQYGIRGGRPYGGACLPKDVLGLIAAARSVGIDPTLLIAVDERNRRTAPDAR